MKKIKEHFDTFTKTVDCTEDNQTDMSFFVQRAHGKRLLIEEINNKLETHSEEMDAETIKRYQISLMLLQADPFLRIQTYTIPPISPTPLSDLTRDK